MWLEFREGEQLQSTEAAALGGRAEQERGCDGTGQAGGHGRDTKLFVGEREGQGRAQEAGGCPEQNQGRGKVSQSVDPCGMGAGRQNRGEAAAKEWRP